jgi:hypothetical protein
MMIDSDVSSEEEDFESFNNKNTVLQEIESAADPVLEVPEYAQEIFKYLKAAEVYD